MLSTFQRAIEAAVGLLIATQGLHPTQYHVACLLICCRKGETVHVIRHTKGALSPEAAQVAGQDQAITYDLFQMFQRAVEAVGGVRVDAEGCNTTTITVFESYQAWLKRQKAVFQATAVHVVCLCQQTATQHCSAAAVAAKAPAMFSVPSLSHDKTPRMSAVLLWAPAKLLTSWVCTPYRVSG